MSNRLKLSQLLPLLLIAIAAGLSLFAIPTIANASEEESAAEAPAHNNLPETEDRQKSGHLVTPSESSRNTDSVGSGRENYYVPSNDQPSEQVQTGQQLYETGCSTCHGLKGEGSEGVPTLQGVGAAAVDFYVGSGRMPVQNIVKQAPRKLPLYTQGQIDKIAEYVSDNFGGGPAVPVVTIAEHGTEQYESDLVEGNKLYASNCAQCHNSAGSGGSLGLGFNAPRLYQATPVEIAEAIRVGPSAMPQWDEDALSTDQVNALATYVEHLGGEAPGGLPLGNTGPVPEGYFAWFIGIGAMLALARWIGTRV